jgi:hypothetical protein
MNAPDENQNTVHSSAYNPFPEPQTIPSGWDTSGFFSAPQPASNEQVERPVKSEDD